MEELNHNEKTQDISGFSLIYCSFINISSFTSFQIA